MKHNPSSESNCPINKTTKLFCLLMTVAVAAIMIFSPISDTIYAKLFSNAAQTKVYLMGDVDLNGKLEPSDARTVLRVSVQLDELDGVKNGEVLPNDKAEPTKGQLADIDGDKRITPSDARAILRMSVMLDEQKTMKVEIPEETTEPITEPSSGDIETTTLPSSNITWEEYVSMYGPFDIEASPEINSRLAEDYYKMFPEQYVPSTSKEYVEPHDEYETKYFSEDGHICAFCGKSQMTDYVNCNYACATGGCSRRIIDWTCPHCGENVPSHTCHTCKNPTVFGLPELMDDGTWL